MSTPGPIPVDASRHPTPAESDAAARGLRGWLLSAAVQLRDGPHTGGVIGALDAAGRPRYVYPEITGYYLHWLAEAKTAIGDGPAGEAAQRAACWTLRQFADGGLPATRAYLAEAEPDWRNAAAFFFDFAMLVRGLGAACEAGLIETADAPFARLVEELTAFVAADGELRAARRLDSSVELPGRWSTLGGPFLVKASSRVALAARHHPLPDALAQACDALAAHHAASAGAIELDMLHPTLYFAEGLLVAQPQAAAKIAVLLNRCLALQKPDGSLPEAEHGSDVPRNDIVAQALRVGLLLRAAGVPGAPTDLALDRLAGALIARLDAQGRLAFRNDVSAPQPNAWCAMFAEQALRWHARWRRGERLPEAEWLV